MQRFIIQNFNRWTKKIEKNIHIRKINLGRHAKFGENRFIFKEIRAKKRCSFLLAWIIVQFYPFCRTVESSERQQSNIDARYVY